MKFESYELTSETGLTRFKFISEGPGGKISKLIEFQVTNNPGLYNLAFGDVDLLTGAIDDLAVSANNDTQKVLATVISAVYAFCDRYPDAFVYASGSTRSRTRLYRMGITKHYKQVLDDFYLYGQQCDDFFVFRPGVDYDGF